MYNNRNRTSPYVQWQERNHTTCTITEMEQTHMYNDGTMTEKEPNHIYNDRKGTKPHVQ